MSDLKKIFLLNGKERTDLTASVAPVMREQPHKANNTPVAPVMREQPHKANNASVAPVMREQPHEESEQKYLQCSTVSGQFVSSLGDPFNRDR